MHQRTMRVSHTNGVQCMLLPVSAICFTILHNIITVYYVVVFYTVLCMSPHKLKQHTFHVHIYCMHLIIADTPDFVQRYPLNHCISQNTKYYRIYIINPRPT